MHLLKKLAHRLASPRSNGGNTRSPFNPPTTPDQPNTHDSHIPHHRASHSSHRVLSQIRRGTRSKKRPPIISVGGLAFMHRRLRCWAKRNPSVAWLNSTYTMSLGY